MVKLAALALIALASSLGATGSLKNANLQREERDANVIVRLGNDVNQTDAINYIRNSVTPNFLVTEHFTTLTNAFSINLNSKYVDTISNLSFVKHVENDVIHSVSYHEPDLVKIPLTKQGLAYTESDNASKQTMNMPDDTNEGEGVSIAILDTGAYLEHDTFTDLDSGVSVKYTQQGIQDLIAGKNFHGKPDLTHSTYWNKKVPFYYDYGGESHVYGEPGEEDYDVLSMLEEHGNHVASIAAGNDPEYKGIAPKAQLLIMKVFTDYTPVGEDVGVYSPSCGAYDSCVLKALEDAYILGVDIINMSLGSDLNDFGEDSIVRQTIAKLQNGGTFVNIASGNSGKGLFSRSGAYANWTTDMVETGILSTYSNSPEAMGVASAVPTFKYYDQAMMVGANVVDYRDQIVDYTTADGEVKYTPNRPLWDITQGGTITHFDWVKIPGWAEVKDFDGLDVHGKIAIVDRGETSFLSKITNSVAAGAIAMVCINNDPSETDFTFYMDLSGETPAIPVVTVLYKDKAIFGNAGDTGAIDLVRDTFANCPDAKTLSDFTSNGATFDYNLKPEIAAPGDSIKGATYIGPDGHALIKNKYEFYSGTSMATPNYCGALAILLGEHLGDDDYRANLNNIAMSTADPMAYTNAIPGCAKSSPRYEGAGMMNIGDALSSKMFLEGVKYGTTEGIKKAKICLFNTDEIAEGKVKLSFKAYSDWASAQTMTAKVDILRPKLVEMDPELYPEFTGVKLQAVEDELIDTFSQSVTIQPGENVINLNEHSIPQDQLDIINEYFTNGCPIEGYVTLTSSNTEVTDLSIPFLGFYGDYDKGAPVEEFDFERDNTKTYPSDLVNNFAKGVLGKNYANMSSMIAVGYIADLEKFSMESWALNDTNFYKYAGFKPIGTNPVTQEIDPTKLYVANNSTINTMLIQQFVTRSVATNDLTLTNKATGEVILRDHMFDSLFGSSGEDGEPANYQLYKSHIEVDYVSAGIIAHRAYSIVPLYDQKTGISYPDGEYEMKFDYTLATGAKYTKSYTLIIDNEAPVYQGIMKVELGGVLYYRTRFEDSAIAGVSINGGIAEVKKDELGYYADVKASDVDSKGKIMLTITDFVGTVTKVLINLTDAHYFAVVHSAMALNCASNVTSTKWQDYSFTLSYSLTQKDKPLSVDGAIIAISVTDDIDLDTLKVYSVDGSGHTTEIDYEVSGGAILVETDATTLRFVMGDDIPEGEKPNPQPVPPAPAEGLPGWALALIIVGGVVLVGGAVALVLVLKKKKATK